MARLIAGFCCVSLFAASAFLFKAHWHSLLLHWYTIAAALGSRCIPAQLRLKSLDLLLLGFYFLFRGGKLGVSVLGIADVCLERHLVLDYFVCSVAAVQVLLCPV